MSELYAHDQKVITERELFEMSPLEIAEVYMLDNLVTVMEVNGVHWGFKVGDKVIPEVCPRCGGYGGDQMEDGWMPCFYCCERGTVYTPVDYYLMGEYHLEALEDNSMHDAMLKHEMEALQLMQRQEARSRCHTDTGINKKANFDDEVEEKDDIPF